jgi:hypothetical protein
MEVTGIGFIRFVEKDGTLAAPAILVKEYRIALALFKIWK